jgi:hypothetical protein
VRATAKRREEGGEVRESSDEAISFFDINQLELAIITRALGGLKGGKVPDFVEIGKNERILRIQKRNLEALLRRKGKETGEGALEGELKKILSGAKIFTFFKKG